MAPDLNEHDTEGRSLINPFRPEEFTIRITANRRRWIHVFPVDKQGRAKLAHHYVVGKSTLHVLQTSEPVANLKLTHLIKFNLGSSKTTFAFFASKLSG